MASVSKNINFFNCPLLIYYKSKRGQIITAADKILKGDHQGPSQLILA
jgi:hypothetical protein